MSSTYPYSDSLPIIEILVQSQSGDWKRIFVQVDSGAFMTVLPKEDAFRLGIELKMGKRTDLHGIGGSVAAYIHPVAIKVAGKIVKAQVAFSSSNETPRLLGRKDIFDNFVICFNDKEKIVSFS